MTVKLYTAKQVAEVLGVGVATVYRRIAAGEIRTIDIGVAGRPKTRIQEEDLRAYLDRSKTSA